jgi:Flp pilus assembly protein TadG
MRTPAVPTHRQNQRGIALAYFGVAMLTLIAFAVIGIDLGRLAFTASEVQSVADAAATAAALAKVQGSTDPVGQATTVVQKNSVDGHAADVGAGEVVDEILPGRWDFENGTFTEMAWTDKEANAARAHATKTVTNFVAGAIGAPESSVHRYAIAAAGGACDARTLMPIAIGDCYFNAFLQGDPSDPNRCSGLPQIQFSNTASDNACFTSLGSGSAAASKMGQYLPTQCNCSGNFCNAADPPLVSVGDHINVTNGNATSLQHAISDCLNHGQAEWDVPLVKCNSSKNCPNPAATGGKCVDCTHALEVTGFVHIKIILVKDSGSPKFIKFSSACMISPGSSAGCDSSPLSGLAIVK